MRASADQRAQATLGVAVLGATGLGWLALTVLAGSAVPLCGMSAEGVASLGRLVGMWSLMVATMMLPPALILAGAGAARDRAGFLLGYVAVAIQVAIVAGLAEWILRAWGWMPAATPVASVQIMLAGIAALGIVRDGFTRHRVARRGIGGGLAAGHSHLGACIAMIAIQLAFGSMDLLLMAALALWMLAAATVPGHEFAPAGAASSRHEGSS